MPIGEEPRLCFPGEDGCWPEDIPEFDPNQDEIIPVDNSQKQTDAVVVCSRESRPKVGGEVQKGVDGQPMGTYISRELWVAVGFGFGGTRIGGLPEHRNELNGIPEVPPSEVYAVLEAIANSPEGHQIEYTQDRQLAPHERATYPAMVHSNDRLINDPIGRGEWQLGQLLNSGFRSMPDQAQVISNKTEELENIGWIPLGPDNLPQPEVNQDDVEF